jgi:hypothetical protein
MIERLLRALLAALLAATALIGLAQPAAATECGCTEVGPYEAPAVRSWTTGATSPAGGTYTLSTSQNATFATLQVHRTAGNVLVESFTAPLSRLQFGWSPDGKRFMVRHGQPGSTTHDSVVLWDLVGDRQIVSTSMTSGAATGFSPHGRYFYVNQLLGPGWASIGIWNATAPGTVAMSREITFANVPGSGADSFGSIGFGFSSDSADRSFVHAYRAINGTTSVSVRNLETRADVYSTSLTNGSGAFWRFSPCGDAFAIASNQLANTVDVVIRKTAVNEVLGTRSFNPIPAVVTIEATLDHHRIVTRSSTGATTTTNVASNTADTSCPAPPALTSLGLSPTTVTGGTTNSTATLTLTRAAVDTMTAALSSSDTSAATVPASLSFSAGQTTRTFHRHVEGGDGSADDDHHGHDRRRHPHGDPDGQPGHDDPAAGVAQGHGARRHAEHRHGGPDLARDGHSRRGRAGGRHGRDAERALGQCGHRAGDRDGARRPDHRQRDAHHEGGHLVDAADAHRHRGRRDGDGGPHRPAQHDVDQPPGGHHRPGVQGRHDAAGAQRRPLLRRGRAAVPDQLLRGQRRPAVRQQQRQRDLRPAVEHLHAVRDHGDHAADHRAVPG